jgi:putative hydrolase of the HAD superfamily
MLSLIISRWPTMTLGVKRGCAMPIKALMVDVDGVVVVQTELHGWSTHLERDLGLAPARLQEAFFAPHFGDIVHGRAGLRERLSPVLAEIAPHLSAETLIAYWFEKDAHLDVDLLAQIDALRAIGLKAHLATVQEHERADYLWAQLALKDHFDAIHYAADLGYAKPAAEFFRTVEVRTGLAPDQLFFIDDKAANVDAAKALGWRGAVWTGEQTVVALMKQAGVWPDR